MSAAGDYLRNQQGTVTNFDGALSTVADAFDIEAGEAEVDQETGDLVYVDDNGDGDGATDEGPAEDAPAPVPHTRRAPPRRKQRRR